MRFPLTSLSKLSNCFLKFKELSYNGKWPEIFFCYNELKKAEVQVAEPSIFPLILKASLFLSIRHGKSIHASLIKHGFISFASVENSIMDLYTKSGDLGSAIHVFDSMSCIDSVSWNIIIHGHLDQNESDVGLWLFMRARVTGFEPNIATLVLVIRACRNLRAVRNGQKMHGYIIRSGFGGISSVQNAVLSMYAATKMDLAQYLFDEMCDRDVISWSVMIGGYVQSEESQVGLGLFREMVSEAEVEIDEQAVVSAIIACTNIGNLKVGRLFHGFVICEGFNYDIFVGNTLIDMYSKCGDADSASKIFNEMCQRNIVSWNSLLSGLVHNEEHSKALMLFYSMAKAGIQADEVTLVNLLQLCKSFINPLQCKLIHSRITRRGYESNELIINSLIDVYAKCNLITLAWQVFCRTKRRDTFTWSTMIAGFSHCGMPDEAISVFQEMNWARHCPNAVTMLNLLEACSLSAELKRSKCAHGIAIRRILASDVAVGTAILDMYSKCGTIEASRKVFEQIPQKNVVSWSAMIASYGMNGLPRKALALLSEMKVYGLKPNPVTTLSVLSACGHGGLVEEGLSFFKELVRDNGIELSLEHYSCMVDLLARAGKLNSAMDLIEGMPSELKPGASAWGALLSACRSHGNSDLGSEAVSHVLELEPSNSAGYMLASNMYAAGGSWVDAARMRWMVKQRGVKVVSGYSLVHVDSKMCRFVAGDELHPLFDEVCLSIVQLHSCMKMEERNSEAILE